MEIQQHAESTVLQPGNGHERLADYSKERAHSTTQASMVSGHGDPFTRAKRYSVDSASLRTPQNLEAALSTAEHMLSLPTEGPCGHLKTSTSFASYGNASASTPKRNLTRCMSRGRNLSCSDRLKLSFRNVMKETSNSEFDFTPTPGERPTLLRAKTESCLVGGNSSESKPINFSLRRTEKEKYKRAPLRRQHSSVEWLHVSLKNMFIDEESGGERREKRRPTPPRSNSTISLPSRRGRKPQVDTASKETLASAKQRLKEKRSATGTGRLKCPTNSQPQSSETSKVRRSLSPLQKSKESLESLLNTAQRRSSAIVRTVSPDSQTSMLLSRLHRSTSKLLNASNHSLLSESMQTPTMSRRGNSAGNISKRRRLSPARTPSTLQGQQNWKPAVDPKKLSMSKEASTSKLARLVSLSRTSSLNSQRRIPQLEARLATDPKPRQALALSKRPLSFRASTRDTGTEGTSLTAISLQDLRSSDTGTLVRRIPRRIISPAQGLPTSSSSADVVDRMAKRRRPKRDQNHLAYSLHTSGNDDDDHQTPRKRAKIGSAEKKNRKPRSSLFRHHSSPLFGPAPGEKSPEAFSDLDAFRMFVTGSRIVRHRGYIVD